MNDATGTGRVAREAVRIERDNGLIHDPSLSAAAALALFLQPGVEQAQRGRGAIRIVESALGRVVVRHYRRGGLIAKLSTDWFVWTGADATRPLREFRVTQRLHDAGLPVPEVVAARYVRAGLGYRADLATRLIEGVQTLAERLRDPAFAASFDWAALGALIARFHLQGLWHADLNAHNLLIDDAGQVTMIDFDRAQLFDGGAPRSSDNVNRLGRSLTKLGHGDEQHLSNWRRLCEGYVGYLDAERPDR